ncbi:Cellulose synthase catalytic subunit [UDP-forming] [Acidisarcina polymorpha]|uniref:Cellulose synthase catalytic subunit [UDP-forming] n=1 Tax=Acidisarcina polymorpha TaxID=2211140 RepID=A0A2Z5G2T5_9BACT|nr:Cellulose synthase catalytic subunit [UDP-forming] [Acidisarcina polymorpha]
MILLTILLAASLPMSWQQQAAFAAVLVGAGMLLSRFSRGRHAVYLLVLLSASATARYAWWRIGALIHYFASPWTHIDPWNAAAMLLLIGAEMYSFAILYLGFVQTIAPLRRPPVLLPEDLAEWPTVDIMVPTYNEPLDVVRYTVLAAQEIDWPREKIEVYLLDDGNREEFRAFAEAAGVRYIARVEHNHAKAGNINHALAKSSGELIAIFDSDHIPTRSFLQVTAGWFLRDRKLGMLQTPHHFYSPDPFERNLGHFRQIPNEGELFYGIIQDTNDLWNATFFCGSCAVLRRAALDEVHGIAHETVTEDAHTSFRMHKAGWNTAYINLVQSAGLATESIGDHIKQRVRWARGMAQILRIDNPLFARGLKLPQRLCYFNAMAHFFYALPRLIFLTSPICYLVFGKLNIPGYWLTILVFALPHLAMATITNSRIQGEKRHSFWNEIYETVLSPYILLPTMLALISPKLGKFNVTAKGQSKQDDSFDHTMAAPFLVLLSLNVLAVAMAVPRLLYWDPGHRGTIAMNLFWTCFNIAVLGVTLSVCWESKQRRTAVRITTPVPVHLECAGRSCLAVTEDISVGGAAVLAKGEWSVGDEVRISFPEEDDQSPLTAHVVLVSATGISLEFDSKTIEDQRLITRVIYSRADRWLNWSDVRARDNPVRSLYQVALSSLGGFGKMLRLSSGGGDKNELREPAFSRNIAMLVLLISMLLLAYWKVNAEPLPSANSQHARTTFSHPSEVANFQFSLGSLAGRDGILLNHNHPSQTIAVDLPATALVESGELRLKYGLPEGSKGGLTTFDILLNELPLASITPTMQDVANRGGEVEIPLPADQLIRENRITIRLASGGDGACGEVAAAGGAPIRIDPETRISLEARRLATADDLSLLPEPFLEKSVSVPLSLPFVFAEAPELVTLEAAGVLASWAGSEVYNSASKFPAQMASIPAGNAVVLLVGDQRIVGLSTPPASRASVSVVSNPVDPLAKLLVLHADSPASLLELVQALVLGQIALSGQSASVGGVVLPGRRAPNDAPRWIHADRVMLSQLAGTEHIQVEGSNPLNFYLHFAPDFNFGNRKDMYLHLTYSTGSQRLDRLGPRSNIEVRLNGNPADSVPLTEGAAGAVNIPLGDLPAAVFANTMQIQFYAVPRSNNACGDIHFSATVADNSFLDMGGAAHLAFLPDLLLFANAGFPFTRFADLSETAVLLPASPSVSEITLYLDLMGHFGAQTGLSALRVQVGSIGNEIESSNKDLLVLGTFEDLAAMHQSLLHPPLRLYGGSWSLSIRARIAQKVESWLHPGAASLFNLEDNAHPDGVIEGIRSPYSGERSIVFILGKDDAALDPMTSELMAQLPHDSIHGNVSIWEGASFGSYLLVAPGYAVGDSSPLERLRLLLPQYPLTVALALLLLCSLFAIWIQIWIGHRVWSRLVFQADESGLGDSRARAD